MKVNFHKKLLHKSMSLLVVILLVLVFPDSANSQEIDTTKIGLDDIGHYLLYRNHDTSYIKNYGLKLDMVN